MLILLLNGVNIDLDSSATIAIDYNKFTLNEPTKRKTPLSIGFKLPPTVGNRRFFEGAEDITSLTRKPYRVLPARLYVDGIDQGIRFFWLEDVSVNEAYNVRLFGNMADFFAAIKKNKLSQLDFSEYNHIWELDNVFDSRDNTAGFIYPVIDYGVDNEAMDNTARVINPRYMLPSLFVDTILEKIVSEAGYTLVNHMASDANYTASPLLYPTTKNRATVFKDTKYNAKFKQTTDIALNDYRYKIQLSDRFGPVFQVGDFVHETTGISPPFVSGEIYQVDAGGAGTIYVKNVINGTFAAPNEIDNDNGTTGEIGIVTVEQSPNTGFAKPNTVITYDGTWYTVPYAFSTLDFEDKFPIQVYLVLNITNTNTIDSIVDVFIKTGAMANEGIMQTLTVPVGTTTYNVSVIDGAILLDEFSVPVTFALLNAPDNIVVSYKVREGSEVTILSTSTIEIKSGFVGEYTNKLAYGARVQVSALLPDTTQGEFFSDYCQLYCLIADIDEESKTVTFRRFSEIPANASRAKDWSNKVDLSIAPVVSYVPDGYAQESNFVWATDGDEQQPAGATGTLLVDNENLPAILNVVDLKFASTFATTKLLEIPVPKIGVYEGSEFTNPKTPRLLLLQQTTLSSLSNTADLTYNDGAQTETLSGAAAVPLTRFIDTARAYNLGFGDSILSDYYPALYDVLKDYKKVTIYLRLNAVDVSQLDFFTPVYIKHLNGYFYINSIQGYLPDETTSTKVELIKLF